MAVSEKMVEALLLAKEFLLAINETDMTSLSPDVLRKGIALGNSLAVALEAAEATRGGEHIGWLYFNEDTGAEWSEQNPLESGECPDATRVRPATCENLLFELKAAWELAADASRDAAPPAGTVAVRVCTAMTSVAEMPGYMEGHTFFAFSDGTIWCRCQTNGDWARVEGPPATIHAPLPAVPEVGAVVEDPTP